MLDFLHNNLFICILKNLTVLDITKVVNPNKKRNSVTYPDWEPDKHFLYFPQGHFNILNGHVIVEFLNFIN